jgi:hypothetical protein
MKLRFLAPVLLLAACEMQVTGLGPVEQMGTNEKLAVSRLRTVAAAQTQAQCLAVIDTDEDGQGEYAYLRELTGAAKARQPGDGIKFPLLGSGLKRLGPGGGVSADGYNFRVFLPGAGGTMLGAETADGEVSADGAETRWVCYAWPVRHGVTGRRTFVIDQDGRILATEAKDGWGSTGPDALAAYEVTESGEPMVGPDWSPVEG